MPDLDPSLRKAADFYRGFMSEVRIRLTALEENIVAVRAQPNDHSAFLRTEFCYLQMRFVCELIALAALAANSLSSQHASRKLLKTWQADQIFRQLQRINPHSYPMPVRETQKPEGGLHFEKKSGGVLQRDQLGTIYGACGNCLHRGTLARLSANQTTVYNLADLEKWSRSAKLLLAQHIVLLPQLNTVFLVRMNDGQGNVSVAICKGVHGDSFAVLGGA